MKVHRVSQSNIPFRCELEIAGLVCLVESNRVALLRVLEYSWPMTPAGGPQGFALRVIVQPRKMRGAAQAPHFRGMQHLVFATFHGEDVFVFDVLRRTVMAVVSEETAVDASFWNRVLFPIAMGVMGPSMGSAPLHCACLARAGDGVLIAGESGAGKSTLSVALAQSGYEFVSDDWTYARRGVSRGLVAHGLKVPAKLLPDCAKFFPELKRLRPAITMNGELAYEAEISEVFGAKVRGECRVEKLVLLRRSKGAKGRLTRIDGKTAREFFHRSAERLPPELYDAGRQRAEIIDELVGVECFSFQYGETPMKGAEILSRLLEGRV